MKNKKFITTFFISCLTVSAGFLLTDQASAASAEDAEKIIAETTQQLAELKETKQNYSKQQDEKTIELSDLTKEIQTIQTKIEQLESIDSVGKITEISEQSEQLSEKFLTGLSATLSTTDNVTNPINEKKEQLLDLIQQQELLQEETTELSTNQKTIQYEEKKLSEKIDQAKQDKEEQAKKMDTRSAVVAAAKTHLGKPYVYGASGPDSFDCSGLVQVAFAAIGHSVGRTTVAQESAGTTIPVAEAQAGDLVFWGSHGGTYHVGISTGDGSYIHAPVPGDVVQIATVASYTPDFAVRVL